MAVVAVDAELGPTVDVELWRYELLIEADNIAVAIGAGVLFRVRGWGRPFVARLTGVVPRLIPDGLCCQMAIRLTARVGGWVVARV